MEAWAGPPWIEILVGLGTYRPPEASGAGAASKESTTNRLSPRSKESTTNRLSPRSKESTTNRLFPRSKESTVYYSRYDSVYYPIYVPTYFLYISLIRV